MMRISFTIAMLFALLLGTSSVSAQTLVVASRTTACTLNPGSTMADVVETARNFEFAEDTAPAVVLMRSKIAAAGGANSFGPEYDFLVTSYYPSYSALVERRGRFLQRQAGRNGLRGLAPFATCSDNVVISSVRFATPANPGAAIPPLTAAVTVGCALNGATIDDAVAMNGAFAERVGASVGLVSSRSFGGPRRPFNSGVGYMINFPSFDDFGTAWDELQQNPTAPDPDNPISCSGASLWAQYLIHQTTAN